jgi:Mg-chelatase subunit ChlD
MYVLTDAYGNPAGGQGLWVNSSGLQGQSKLINSSSGGEVWVTYGPEASAGVVTITATAAANASVSDSTEVEFASTEPVDMVISASPRSMPSRDANANSVSELRAKVIDIRGNPVAGETVTFEIVSNRSAPYNQTVDQVLETGFAITNSDGSAIVKFRPGAFTNVREAPGWDAAANGTATVQATWENVTRGCHVTQDIDLTWMNYPYLSVETEVSRATVSVNSTDGVSNTTDVTIRLKGDGWALQPDPIDAVLVIDRSGSMLYDNPDRMHSVREAAELFVDNMSERDRVGLVTFGRNTGSGNQIGVPGECSFDNPQYYINNIYNTPKQYLDYATVDQPLTNVLSSVKGELGNIVPDYGTPMRGGIYKAINELSVNGSSDTVKAVILLSDGDYNWYGDPLARGTGYSNYDPTNYGDLTPNYYKFGNLSNAEQNLSVYAQHKNVAIYSVGYANSISPGGIATLKTLAESTGGKYYNGSAANIGAIYTAIAGELKTEAGVDTSMTVFENVEVNGAPRSAADVFDYNYTPGISTHILNKTKTDVLYNDTINQINDWERDKQLHFDIGTVRLNQNWTTTFRVAVKPSYEADGDDNNINIFGPGATLSFNNGIDTLPLPATFITVYPDLTNTGIGSSSLAVEFTGPGSDSGPFVDVVPLTWTTTYNGTQGVDVFLASSPYEDGRQSSVFFTKTLPAGTFAGEDTMITDSTMMDVRDLAPGKYWITVTASARDAKTAEDTTSLWAHIKDPSRSHIKIG